MTPCPEVVRLDPHGMPERIWSLGEGPLLFGRGIHEGNHVRFSENMQSVSRLHARISRGLLGGWFLKDLGSEAGTFANGVRVKRCRLQHDDTIVIAGVHFKFRDASHQKVGEIVVTQGSRKGDVLSLDNGDVPVGRKVASPHGLLFPPEEGSVSATHCRVRKKRNDYFLDDLGSKNGTRVNGKRVVGSTILKDGDRIQLGEVELRVRIRWGRG